jgi:hypothetical protein
MSDDDGEPIYRPSENEVVERYSSDAGLSGESGLLSADVPPVPAEDHECVVTGVTLPNVNALENKPSNVSGISALDALLMHAKREEIEAKHALIIQRYKALQLEVNAGLHEIMGQTPHVSQFLSGIPSEATGNLPSVAVDPVSQVQEKNPGAAGAAFLSFLPCLPPAVLLRPILAATSHAVHFGCMIICCKKPRGFGLRLLPRRLALGGGGRGEEASASCPI